MLWKRREGEREGGGQKKIKEEETAERDSEATSEDARTERKRARQEAVDPLALGGRRRLSGHGMSLKGTEYTCDRPADLFSQHSCLFSYKKVKSLPWEVKGMRTSVSQDLLLLICGRQSLEKPEKAWHWSHPGVADFFTPVKDLWCSLGPDKVLADQRIKLR